MNCYFDTEFSLPDSSATELLSIGVVTDDGREFYAELNPLPTRRSEFVDSVVLPLMEGGGAVVNKSDLQRRLAAWLAPLPPPVTLVADSSWDFYVLRKALFGRGSHSPGMIVVGTEDCIDVSVALQLTPLFPESLSRVFDAAVEEYRKTDPRVHHALADAQALRVGMTAVEQWQVERSR